VEKAASLCNVRLRQLEPDADFGLSGETLRQAIEVSNIISQYYINIIQYYNIISQYYINIIQYYNIII